MPIATRSTGETKDADADPDRRHPSQAGHDAPGVPAVSGATRLMHRLGFSPQVPAR
jgi:hypothetical protein